MKKVYSLFLLTILCAGATAQSVFQQSFTTNMATVTNGVATDVTYVGDPPNNSQLTFLAVPTSGTVTVSGGTLNVTTSSTSSRWGAARNQSTENYGGLMVKFDANITVGSSGTSAPKFVFYVGSGLGNNITMDANSSIHSGFGIKYQNSSYYYMNTLSGTNVTTQYAEGTSRTFTFVCNNSGGDLTYTAPDATTETVGDDKWDLWVDNVKVFDEQAATTPSQSLTSFKFGDINGNNGRADMVIDNFSVSPLPVPLPVSFITFFASLKNNQVQTNWTVVNESNLLKYEIERAIDGRKFEVIGNVIATNLANEQTYSFTDHAPVSFNNYYRIKAIEKDGSGKYSSVIKVSTGKQNMTFSVAPNPVEGKRMNVLVNNITAGNYTIEVLNLMGQKVYSTTLPLQAGSVSVPVKLPANVGHGLYSLRLTGKDDSKTIQVTIN